MPSIINGLFSARSGISSHGAAIAVVGDNISNSSTPGYKASRAEFQDIIAGGQAAGKIIGSGSSLAAVSLINDQGTLEFTGRTLDMAVDGNGLFAVQDPGGNIFYTRAGNFKLDTEGNIVNQAGLKVLGFPSGGTGSLEEINVNTVSQDNIASNLVNIVGNLDASASTATIPTIPITGGAHNASATWEALSSAATFSTVVDVFDTLGAKHTINFFFFKTAANTFQVRGYVDSGEVGGSPAGYPRQILEDDGDVTPAGNTVTLAFDSSGQRTSTPTAPTYDFNNFNIPWSNGSSGTQDVDVSFAGFTQYSSPSAVNSVSQDGQGIGNVTSLVIDKDGTIFAKLSNGQSAEIGQMGLVSFSNPEGLTRVGGNLLQESPSSGEPLIGRALTGTFGAIQSGSTELSTVDTASEFVKLITLQRGFQANSRIITTINQLLNEIIQLA